MPYRIRKKGKTGYVKIPTKGKIAPLTRGLTKKESLNSWVAGFMSRAREHPKKYHDAGIKRLVFSYKGSKTSRKI